MKSNNCGTYSQTKDEVSQDYLKGVQHYVIPNYRTK